MTELLVHEASKEDVDYFSHDVAFYGSLQWYSYVFKMGRMVLKEQFEIFRNHKSA